MNEPTRLFDFPRFQQEHFPLEVMVSSRLAENGKAIIPVNLLMPLMKPLVGC